MQKTYLSLQSEVVVNTRCLLEPLRPRPMPPAGGCARWSLLPPGGCCPLAVEAPRSSERPGSRCGVRTHCCGPDSLTHGLLAPGRNDSFLRGRCLPQTRHEGLRSLRKTRTGLFRRKDDRSHQRHHCTYLGWWMVMRGVCGLRIKGQWTGHFLLAVPAADAESQ